MRMITRALIAIVVLLSGAVNNAVAQQDTANAALVPVKLEQALYLIRSTLLTLNDANRTGNYTVLRDLAAPDFQLRNTAADLGQIFADLRHRNFDLYGAALLAPQFTKAPALDKNGMLHFSGFIPTQPQQIRFDLVFQNAAERWRLFGIAVATPDALQPQARVEQPAAKETPPKPKQKRLSAKTPPAKSDPQAPATP
ncbi:MAG: hypothetical protein ABIQ51_26230 [Mesorhizobium sp.]